MSEKVLVESIYEKKTFSSSGGYKNAIKEFLVKFPDNNFGTVTIRGVKRSWYIEDGKIKVMKDV